MKIDALATEVVGDGFRHQSRVVAKDERPTYHHADPTATVAIGHRRPIGAVGSKNVSPSHVHPATRNALPLPQRGSICQRGGTDWDLQKSRFLSQDVAHVKASRVSARSHGPPFKLLSAKWLYACSHSLRDSQTVMARMSADTSQPARKEGRRKTTRYELCLKLRYAVLRHDASPITGDGESVNVSVAGLLFRGECRFRNGDSVLAAIDWPVTTPDNERLLLVLTGYVVRTRRPLVALAIASKRLLRASELDERFEVYFAREGNGEPRRERPIALVEGDPAPMSVMAGILGPQQWNVKRADAEGAKWILASGLPKIGLLITRTTALLEYVPPALPVVLTIDEGASETLPSEARLPNVSVVPRALMRTMLADVVQKIYRRDASAASGAPTGAA